MVFQEDISDTQRREFQKKLEMDFNMDDRFCRKPFVRLGVQVKYYHSQLFTSPLSQ